MDVIFEAVQFVLSSSLNQLSLALLKDKVKTIEFDTKFKMDEVSSRAISEMVKSLSARKNIAQISIQARFLPFGSSR